MSTHEIHHWLKSYLCTFTTKLNINLIIIDSSDRSETFIKLTKLFTLKTWYLFKDNLFKCIRYVCSFLELMLNFIVYVEFQNPLVQNLAMPQFENQVFFWEGRGDFGSNINRTNVNPIQCFPMILMNSLIRTCLL